jgi:copper chaperone CopZ
MTRYMTAAVLFVAALLRPSPCAAQISEITINVDGLACPGCAGAVDQNLRTVPTVAGVRVTPSENAAYVRLKKGAAFAPSQLSAAVQKGGEKVRGFGLQMCATVDKANGKYFVRAPGASQRFAVHGDANSKALGPLVGNALVCLKAKVVSTAPIELDLTELTHP